MKFWRKWLKADDPERIKLIETLPFPFIKEEKHFHIFATLVNSYLEDLEEYMKEKTIK
jgi:hypothetical protein